MYISASGLNVFVHSRLFMSFCVKLEHEATSLFFVHFGRRRRLARNNRSNLDWSYRAYTSASSFSFLARKCARIASQIESKNIFQLGLCGEQPSWPWVPNSFLRDFFRAPRSRSEEGQGLDIGHLQASSHAGGDHVGTSRSKEVGAGASTKADPFWRVYGQCFR